MLLYLVECGVKSMGSDSNGTKLSYLWLILLAFSAF